MIDIINFSQLRQALSEGRVLCGRDRPAVQGEYVSGFHYWLEPRADFVIAAHRAIKWIQLGLVVTVETRPDGTVIYQLPTLKAAA